jgi:hypothetical protein
MDPIQRLLSRLRQRDCEELAEYGFTRAQAEQSMRQPHVDFCMWSTPAGPAAAMWFDALTPRALCVSLLATDEWDQVALSVIKYGVRVVRPKLLRLGYTRAECRTMDGHEDAIRLLTHMGFACECRLEGYGATGRDFLQFAWSLKRDVPQGAKDHTSTHNTCP